MSYTISEGFADQITLSNGKLYYTGIRSLNSVHARDLGLEVKTVRFKGCCISCNIMSRAHDNYYFPISIDGKDIYDFINNVAQDNDKIK